MMVTRLSHRVAGFIVESHGLILTNTHVVAQAAAGGVPVIVTLSDGITKLKAVVQHTESAASAARQAPWAYIIIFRGEKTPWLVVAWRTSRHS